MLDPMAAASEARAKRKKAEKEDEVRSKRITKLRDDESVHQVSVRAKGYELAAIEELILDLSQIAREDFGHYRKISNSRLLRALASLVGKSGGIKKEKVIKRMMEMSGDTRDF